MLADTADNPITCKPNSYAEPLVVDLSATDRVDFEAAMDGGVALVNYDCKTVRLLKDCRLSGDYKFAGVSRKEEVIHLDNRDEIRANLPISANVKAGGELERASALDIAYVLVGKRSTSALVHRTVLEGSQCGEATHYVRAATVGAFAIQTATKGRVAAAAEVFGTSTSAQSGSEKQSAKKDGDPKACEQSKPNASAPPGECRSAIRFELVPIQDNFAAKDKKDDKKDDKKGNSEAKSLSDPCPEGFHLISGKCSLKTSDTKVAYLCHKRDVADCEAQCAAGHMGSCYNLGNLAFMNYYKDVSNEQNIQDEKRALSLWKQSCEGGVLQGCSDYGYARSTKSGGMPPDTQEAVSYSLKACDGGFHEGCSNLAGWYLNGRAGVEKDVPSGMQFLNRACKLGDSDSCLELGEFYFSGKYVARDPITGDKLLSQFCNQGNDHACADLANHLLGLYDDDEAPEKPVPEIKDAKARGRALYEKACKASDKSISFSPCDTLGRLLSEEGDPRGRSLLSERCPDSQTDKSLHACSYLGASLFDGKGGPADKAKGVALMAKSNLDAYKFRAALAYLQGDGVKKNEALGKRMLRRLCHDEAYKPACEAGGE
jgi:TPR repeat protein